MKKKIGHFFSSNISIVLAAVFILLFSYLVPAFSSVQNIVNILRQSSYLVVAALGSIFILISGEIDLSIGHAISFIGISTMYLMTRFSWSVTPTILFALALGVFLAVLNTMLSYFLGLKLILISIGAMTIIQGLSYTITTPMRVISGFPREFKILGQGYIGSIPISILITAALCLFIWFILTRTFMGRYVFALGRNESAVKLAGINVFVLRIFTAVMSGLMTGMSAILLCSRLGAIKANSAENAEITIITAYLLGGGSVHGGCGRLLGTVAGILTLSITTNGLHLAGADTYFQLVVKGIIFLAALSFEHHRTVN